MGATESGVGRGRGGALPVVLRASRVALVAAVASAAWIGIGAAPARADEDADRVARLEEALKRQAEETARLKREFEAYRAQNPTADRMTSDEIRAAVDTYLATSPAPAPVLVSAAEGGLQWGGYYSFEFLETTGGKHSFFDLHRLILSGDAAITDCISLQFEFEIEHGGIGNQLDGDVNFEYAEVVFHASDAFNPKLGALLIPFGRYNLHHDDPLNDFTLRPFTARYLVPTGFGQPGIGVEGTAPFGCGHVFAYDVALTNGFEDDFTSNAGARSARQPWDGDNNDAKQVWGRAAVTWCAGFVDYLETGVSGTYAKYDDHGDDDLTGVAFDLLVRKGPFEFKGEYVRYDLERGADDPANATEALEALWLEAGYHFMPGFLACSRNCFVQETSHFTLCARYMWQDLNDQVDGGAFEDDLTAWSLGLNYRITERTVFKFDHTWYEAEEADDRREFAFSFATYF